MPSRRAVLGGLAAALSGCAGRAGRSDGTDRRTDDSGGAPSAEETFAGVAVPDGTSFDRPAVETPDPDACSRAPRPPAAAGADYPDHPGDVTELSGLRFARAYETALARSRAAETADVVAAEPVASRLKAPGNDEWYVVAVTVELTARAGGDERIKRVGGTYFLTDAVAMRTEGPARVDGDATDTSEAAVVACR